MSWSKSYSSKADFEANNSGAYSQEQDSQPHVADQIAIAREVAKRVIDSGAVGDPIAAGKDFFVTLSGHGNPSHEPASGWANDCITVSVTQKA